MEQRIDEMTQIIETLHERKDQGRKLATGNPIFAPARI